jgi:protection-of-telomeres protein 1
VALSEILKPLALTRNEEGQQTPSSFTCAKYRANVRVVDFFPHKVEDFAVGRRPSEYDILSDYSGGEDTDREEDIRVFKSGRGFAKNIWEWRFVLQVEDASSKESKERLWLMVDNHAAQGLLNLEDDATK